MTAKDRRRLSNVIFSAGLLLCLLGLAMGTWVLILGWGVMMTSLFVGPSLVELIEARLRSKDLERRLEADTRAAALRAELEEALRRDRD